jgi:hypothetical protein
MVQRSKRSMSPGKAKDMQAEVRQFHNRVRTWCGEIPVGEQVYIALDVLNFALNLTHSQLNQQLQNPGPDAFTRLYRSDVDAGD